MSTAEIRKAIVAALVAFTGSAATAAVDDRISSGEWWVIAAATAAALGGVWAVPNAEPAHIGEHRDEPA